MREALSRALHAFAIISHITHNYRVLAMSAWALPCLGCAAQTLERGREKLTAPVDPSPALCQPHPERKSVE